jgi:glucose-1-phosphate thymidylyltransferase
MIGVILAGGTGSRLRPLTKVTNKHLLPIYDRPMIFYPLELLKSLGIKEIIIVTGKEFCGDFTDLFGDGSEFGVEITYKVQNGAGGIAQALALTKNIVNSQNVVVVLGDNIFALDEKDKAAVKKAIQTSSSGPSGATVFLKDVSDASRFGVAEVDKSGNVIMIEEKPKAPKSNYAVTGLYICDNTVFDKISKLKPSHRGELEMTDTINAYVREKKLKSVILRGEWSDAGTFESLFKANMIAKEQAEKKSG